MHIIDALGRFGHQVVMSTREDKETVIDPPAQIISPGQHSFSL